MNKFVFGAILIAIIAFYLIFRPPVSPQAPSPSPTGLAGDTLPAANYTDPDFGYALYIPAGMTTEKQSKYSTLFYPKDQPMGQGPTNFIYVSVVTPEMQNTTGEVYNYNKADFEKLIALENIGQSITLGAENLPDLSQWFTYTVVGEVDIDNGRAKNFENTKPWEFPAGTTENRFIYGTQNNIYILGYYTGGDSGATIDPREAYKSILSFKAKGGTSNSFTSENIADEIKTQLVAKHGPNAEQLNVTISKVEGNYAQGGASVIGEGGGMWFAAKVNGKWELVWDGNGIITCDDLTAYPDFPTGMIPQCFDEATDNIVTR